MTGRVQIAKPLKKLIQFSQTTVEMQAIRKHLHRAVKQRWNMHLERHEK